MRQTKDIASIFARYDISAEVERQVAHRVSDDELLQQVADCVIKGEYEIVEQVGQKALKTHSPLTVINEGLIAGMAEVSRLWDAGTYFLPQVILSSDAMSAGVALCEARMGRPLKKKGKVVTHTAEGDIHDLGQVIVNILLNANGFEVINLGADVPVDDVIAACQVHHPLMVTGTALMTTTMTAFPKIAVGLKARNLHIPLVCGGGAVSEEFVTDFDLGIWGKEASQAPEMAEDALAGMGWEEMRAKWNG